MPRKNSTTWSIADPITALRLNDFNEDLDDIYVNGNDRGRIQEAASATALKIDIAAFSYRVGNINWLYAGGTDISVTDAATNYVEIDDTWTIQINTIGWTDANARLWKVTASGGVITDIEIWKPDVLGGLIWGSTKIERQYIVWSDFASPWAFNITFSSLTNIDYILLDFSGSTDTSANVSRDAVGQWYYDGTNWTCAQKQANGNDASTYIDRIVQLDFVFLSDSATILNSSLTLSGNQLSGTLTNTMWVFEVCFTAVWS